MKHCIYLLFALTALQLNAQVLTENLQYEPSAKNPWGLPNPSIPEITQYAEMIGTCDCKSVARNPDQSWADTTDMVWKFKYIMNGTAVQDEVWRNGGRYAGSIRQFHPDSSQWIVTYFSNPGTSWSPGVWHGKRKENEIILYKDQKAPNGLEGFYKISFYDMKSDGFNWKGEWVNKTETFSYPTWMIFCDKRKTN